MPYKPPPAPALAVSSSQGDKYLGVPDDYVTKYGGSAPITGDVQMRPDLNPVYVNPIYESDGPNTTSALQAIASLPPESMARLQIRLAKAGLIGPSTAVSVGVADDTTIDAYKELLGIANRYGMNDVDALGLLESDPSKAQTLTGKALANGGGTGSTSQARTQTQSVRFTPLDAESAADQAYQAALGRDSKPHEQKALRAALNAYAKANPSTTSYDAEGNSVTTGGINEAGIGQIALDQAKAAPDYAETQAAAFYMPELMKALGATANVDGTA